MSRVFIFTASHNLDDSNEDMEIKFNEDIGVDIPEGKNNEVLEASKRL